MSGGPNTIVNSPNREVMRQKYELEEKLVEAGIKLEEYLRSIKLEKNEKVTGGK